MEHDAGLALAHHLGRALQLTNILRDLDEDAALGRLYLPREALQRPASPSTDPREVAGAPGARASLRAVVELAESEFRAAQAIMAQSPRRVVRAPRIMGEAYHIILEKLVARGFAAPRAPVRLPKASSSSSSSAQPRSDGGTTSTSSAPASPAFPPRCGSPRRAATVVVHEATAFAGGRCRSYHDAAIGMTIDNGNHLLLSGNHAALAYLRGIGAEAAAGRAGERANFPSSISQAASAGRCASTTGRCRSGCSIQRGACRTPACSIICRWRGLLWAPAGKPVGEVIACEGTLYRAAGPAAAAGGAQHRCAARDRRGLPAPSCAKRWRSAAAPAGR